jgi:GAF domain-containing protein
MPQTRTASERRTLVRLTAAVFSLSLLVLAYIVVTVLTASPQAPDLTLISGIAVDIIGVALGATLVAASGSMLLWLRSFDTESDEAGASVPSESTETARTGGVDVNEPPERSAPASIAELDGDPVPVTVAERAGYAEIGLDIAVLFTAALARTTVDLDGFLNRATELLAERCAWGAPAADGSERAHVAIYLLDERGEWAYLQAASSVSGKELVLRGHRLRRGDETGVGWVMRKRRVWRGAGEVGAYSATPELPAMRSTIALPLLAGGAAADDGDDVLGVLDVHSVQEDAYTEEDVEGLQRIASYLGVAISTLRRLRDQTAAPGLPSPFYEAATRLAAADSEDAAYSVMLNALSDFDPARTVIVRTATQGSAQRGREEPPESLWVVTDAARSAPPGDSTSSSGSQSAASETPASMSPVSGRLGTGSVKRGAGFAGITPPSLFDITIMGLSLDGPLWVEDLGSMTSFGSVTRFGSRGAGQRPHGAAVETGREVRSPELASALRELAESSSIGALAFIPLRITGQVTAGSPVAGGILVLYGTPHRFAPRERHLHQLFADLGGVALERSRLFTEASRQVERERRLTEIRARLRASFDPDVILRTTVRELGQALSAELTLVELAGASGASASVVSGDELTLASEDS